MRRHAFVLPLLLAACGGHQHEKPTATTAAEPADPRLAFRRGYTDPGGMWMPSQMTLPQHAETMKKLGVSLDAKVLADPLSAPLAAVVSLGGCTGSFVSTDGLIVTNHHCVQSALQLNSTATDNLVENGFLAKTLADEKPAGPTQRVLVVQSYKDVTHEMRDGLDKLKNGAARNLEMEQRDKILTAACEKDRPGTRCRVATFFRGGLYQLIESIELRDIRVVYAPARSVGDFGGEVDNWEWPRHTGDWSYFRAYVGKDGKPADFSTDNVPYKPAHHLQVTTAGLRNGDFVMVTGYPGRTSRMAAASEVHQDIDWTYPYVIEDLRGRYALAEQHLKDPGETGIKASVAKQFVQNGLEKYEGILANMKKGDLLARKDALDEQVKAFVAQPGHEAQKAAVDKMEVILAEQRRTARVDYDRTTALRESQLLSTALQLKYFASERPRKDAERKPGYQDRDMSRALAGQKAFAKRYDRVLDRAEFRLALVRALQVPAAERPWLATLLGVKKSTGIDAAFIDKTIDGWYGAQKLEDEKLRTDLLQHATVQSLEAVKDPFMEAALRIWPVFKAEEQKADARTGELAILVPAYTDAMREVLGGVLAPDANSTLRVTYGTVRSLRPESNAQADRPFTVASQIVAKETGKEPFNSPSKLLAAVKAHEYGPYADPTLGGELAIDFLSDLDITGGNSGSPTLNGKGELVGLAFDGNKEGIASDVVFNGGTTRTIHVDARYMIWTMEHLDGAQHLVTEMGLPLKMK